MNLPLAKDACKSYSFQHRYQDLIDDLVDHTVMEHLTAPQIASLSARQSIEMGAQLDRAIRDCLDGFAFEVTLPSESEAA